MSKHSKHSVYLEYTKNRILRVLGIGILLTVKAKETHKWRKLLELFPVNKLNIRLSIFRKEGCILDVFESEKQIGQFKNIRTYFLFKLSETKLFIDKNRLTDSHSSSISSLY